MLVGGAPLVRFSCRLQWLGLGVVEQAWVSLELSATCKMWEDSKEIEWLKLSRSAATVTLTMQQLILVLQGNGHFCCWAALAVHVSFCCWSYSRVVQIANTEFDGKCSSKKQLCQRGVLFSCWVIYNVVMGEWLRWDHGCALPEWCLWSQHKSFIAIRYEEKSFLQRDNRVNVMNVYGPKVLQKWKVTHVH